MKKYQRFKIGSAIFALLALSLISVFTLRAGEPVAQINNAPVPVISVPVTPTPDDKPLAVAPSVKPPQPGNSENTLTFLSASPLSPVTPAEKASPENTALPSAIPEPCPTCNQDSVTPAPVEQAQDTKAVQTAALPAIPSGFVRAASNPNFAFYYKRYACGNYPGHPVCYDFKIYNAKTQKYVRQQTGWYDPNTCPNGVHDVSPDGKVFIYGTKNRTIIYPLTPDRKYIAVYLNKELRAIKFTSNTTVILKAQSGTGPITCYQVNLLTGKKTTLAKCTW